MTFYFDFRQHLTKFDKCYYDIKKSLSLIHRERRHHLKKFNNKRNIIGNLIKTARENKKYTKVDLCRELELIGIEMSRNEIYRIEHNQMSVKDFELVAFCIVLDIDFTDLKNYFDL